MKKLVTCLFLVLLISCGDDGARGPVGPVGSQGPIGSSGSNGKDAKEYFHILSGRTYSPSTWNSNSKTIQVAAEYKMPEKIYVLTGNAGTGWASIEINDTIKLCYQGNSLSNSSESYVFIYDHIKTNGAECYSNTGKESKITTQVLEVNDVIKLNVNGGGCGSLCKNTDVVVYFN